MKMIDKCPIWDVTAELNSSGDKKRVNSSRLGGSTIFSDEFLEDFNYYKSKDSDFQYKLTEYINRRRIAGETTPNISNDDVDDISSIKPPTVSEMKDRFFYELKDSRPGELYNLIESKDETNYFICRVGSKNYSELIGLIKIFESEDLIKCTAYDFQFKITSRGFNYIDLTLKSNESKIAFVAMWFGLDLDSAYENAIAPAIKINGFDPLRIDRKQTNEKIDDEIIAGINRSKFMVADFTSYFVTSNRKKVHIPRGGVYFEAGYAKGIGRTVIFTVRKSDLDELHFDTRQFAHIVWENELDLKTKLKNRIEATIIGS